MHRLLWIALFALGCAHEPRPTPQELADNHVRLLNEHHIIDGRFSIGGHLCRARLIPLDSGQCTTRSYVEGAKNVDEGTVACGQAINLCNQPLSCDCSNPLPADPCKGQTVQGFGRAGNVSGGGFLLYLVGPPEKGVCQLISAVTGAAGNTNATFAVYGESIPIEPSRHCTCEDFK